MIYCEKNVDLFNKGVPEKNIFNQWNDFQSIYSKKSIHFAKPKFRMYEMHCSTLVFKNFIPELREFCPNFILQQVGDRSQTSAYTFPYIRSLVPKLVEREFWPPHCHDLNYLNYYFSG